MNGNEDEGVDAQEPAAREQKGLRHRRAATAELLAHVVREGTPMPLDQLMQHLNRLADDGVISRDDSLVQPNLLGRKALANKTTITKLRDASVPRAFIKYLRDDAAKTAKIKGASDEPAPDRDGE